MTDTQWTDWIEHKAGDPCPIPDAKGGEYELRFANGEEGCVQPFEALWWSKGVDSWGQYNSPNLTITHYRLRKPPVDWKGIAEELADALKEAQAALNGAPNTVGLHSQMENAVTRYSGAIK